MKLRSDREGKPFIVLEAGDIATLEKAAALLASASVHVGDFPQCDLADTAGAIRRVLRGEAQRVTLPKSRAKKPAPQPSESESAEPPAEQAEQPPFTVPNLCDRCGEPLVPSELRRSRRVCFSCAPLRESA